MREITSLLFACHILLLLVLTTRAEDSGTQNADASPSKPFGIFCKIKCLTKEQCPRQCLPKSDAGWTKRRGPMGSPGIGDMRLDDYLFLKLLGN